VTTPQWEVIGATEKPTLPIPLVIKAPRQGSTVGVYIIKEASKLEAALAEARKFDRQLLVEEFVPGRELTIGILGDQTLPILEIIPKGGFYDFTNKYPFLNPQAGGGAEHVCPAKIEEKLTRRIQQLALRPNRAIGTQGQLLNPARQFLFNFRRTNVLRAAAGLRVEKWILVGEIVKAALGNDFKNGQRLIAQNSDRQFAARDELFHQELSVEFARFGERRLQLTGFLNNIDSDSRSLPRCFDHQGNGQRRLFGGTNHLPLRGGDTSRLEFLFRFDFIEGGSAFHYSVAGIGNATIFQNLLELPVFAKRSVDGEEGEINIFRQFKIFIADIDLENLRAARAQCFGD